MKLDQAQAARLFRLRNNAQCHKLAKCVAILQHRGQSDVTSSLCELRYSIENGLPYPGLGDLGSLCQSDQLPTT